MSIFPHQRVYKADGNVQKTKSTSSADAIEFQRAKWAQTLTNKVFFYNSVIKYTLRVTFVKKNCFLFDFK